MSYRPALVRLTLSNGAIDEIHIADLDRQEAVLSRLRFGRIFHEPLFIDTPGTTATYRANAIVRIDIDLCTSLLEGLRSKFPAELREVEADEPLLNPGLDRDATTMRMEFAGAGSVRLQATYPKPSPMEQRMFLRQFAEAEFLFFQTQAGYTLLNMAHLVATYFTPGVDSLPTGAWHADAAPTPEPVA